MIHRWQTATDIVIWMTLVALLARFLAHRMRGKNPSAAQFAIVVVLIIVVGVVADSVGHVFDSAGTASEKTRASNASRS